jgi:hypothetical protein
MSCTICFNSFDHSVHKPYTLSCLLHTYCISCIEKLDKKNCPICNEPITKKHPNIALLEFIPESKYDKLKSETLKSLHELKEIKQNLNQKRDEKLTELLISFNYNFEIYMNLTLFLISKSYLIFIKNKSWIFRNYIK